MDTRLIRPDADEYAPYYGRYVSLLGDGDILVLLRRRREELNALLGSLDESRALHRYAPGKWSVKEVIGHLTDAERVFAHRALRFARSDQTPLPGFEENDYVRAARFDRRTLASLLAEYNAARASHLLFFEGLDEEAWMKRGTANDVPFTVRALANIIAGHDLHHQRILAEHYLAAG